MRAFALLCAPTIVGLAMAPAADATSSFTWTGNSPESSWSAAKNWEGEAAPSNLEPVALDFPRIASCTGSTCYTSINDLSGLNVESMSIDDGDEYEISGNPITLGGGGLTASPAGGSSGPAGDFVELPISLNATQTWSIAGRNGGAVGENGVFLAGGLVGAGSSLTIDVSNGAAALLASNTEVGPVAINGTNASEPGILNGFVDLLGVGLNSSDKNPLSLSHIFFVGAGAVGPLTTNTAELVVEKRIETPSATFDAASDIGFEISGPGTAAGTEYSQLVSTGAIALGDSSLLVHVSPPPKKTKSEPEPPCPSLAPGQKYTFLSTTGTLSGTFANAPEGGSEISISFAKICSQLSQTMRIGYNRSGGTETVTGTVEAEAKEKQEKETKEKEAKEEEAKKNEEALKKLVEEHARQVAEEAAAKEAAKKHEEEAIAAASKKHQEEEAAAATTKKNQEEAAKGRGPGAEEGSSDATTASTSLTVQGTGVALVKLDCKGSESCSGKLTLSVKPTTKKTGKKSSSAMTIGSAKFSVAAGKTTTVKLVLSAGGRALLSTGHGRLNATLTILKSFPAPSQTHTENVHLVQQKSRGKTKK